MSDESKKVARSMEIAAIAATIISQVEMRKRTTLNVILPVLADPEPTNKTKVDDDDRQFNQQFSQSYVQHS
jgi:hypothetical protein